MAAALGVGVSQLVHQDQLRLSLQCGVQVKFPQLDAFIRNVPDGQLLQPIQQSHGFRTGVGLDITRHHIHASGLGPLGGLQHGVGLANARGITEEYLQPAASRLLRLLDAPQQTVRIRPSIILHDSCSSL